MRMVPPRCFSVFRAIWEEPGCGCELCCFLGGWGVCAPYWSPHWTHGFKGVVFVVCWPLRSELSPGWWRWSLVCLKSVLSPEAPCEGTAHCPAGGLCGWSSHPSQLGSRALPSPDSDFALDHWGLRWMREPRRPQKVGLYQPALGPRPPPAQQVLPCSVPRPWTLPGELPDGDLRGAAVLFRDGAPEPCAGGRCTWRLAKPWGRCWSNTQAEGPEGSCCPCSLLPRVCFPLRAACFLLLSVQEGHVGQG